MVYISGGFECYMQKDMVSAYKFEFYMQKTMLTFGQMMLRVPRKRSCARKKADTNEKIQLKRVGFFGSGTRIRTQTYRVRVCCATFTQYRYISVPEYCITLPQGCQYFFTKLF